MGALSQNRDDVLGAAIPNSSVVERMGVERRPVGEYAGKSSAAKAYRALFEEIDAVP
jgi:cellulose biosynthesis protein BcsQ